MFLIFSNLCDDRSCCIIEAIYFFRCFFFYIVNWPHQLIWSWCALCSNKSERLKYCRKNAIDVRVPLLIWIRYRQCKRLQRYVTKPTKNKSAKITCHASGKYCFINSHHQQQSCAQITRKSVTSTSCTCLSKHVQTNVTFILRRHLFLLET